MMSTHGTLSARRPWYVITASVRLLEKIKLALAVNVKSCLYSQYLFVFQTWIREKAKLIESTDELGNDLSGVITLQRRLSGLERDLAAIQAKLDSLQSEADRLSDEKPEEAEAIRVKITQITELWQELKQMVSRH